MTPPPPQALNVDSLPLSCATSPITSPSLCQPPRRPIDAPRLDAARAQRRPRRHFCQEIVASLCLYEPAALPSSPVDGSYGGFR